MFLNIVWIPNFSIYDQNLSDEVFKKLQYEFEYIDKVYSIIKYVKFYNYSLEFALRALKNKMICLTVQYVE